MSELLRVSALPNCLTAAGARSSILEVCFCARAKGVERLTLERGLTLTAVTVECHFVRSLCSDTRRLSELVVAGAPLSFPPPH